MLIFVEFEEFMQPLFVLAADQFLLVFPKKQ
jgi:hypothetical protein